MTGNNRGIKRPRLAATVAGAAVLPLLLAGCFNGFDAQTSSQPPSGDGLSTEVGNIMIRSAVWVRSEKSPSTMTLSSTLVNTGKTPDQLIAVSTNPKAFVVGLTGGQITVPPLSVTRTAYNSTQYVNGFGINVPPSGYVQTTFVFKIAGTVTGSVLAVPPTGQYAGIQPTLPPQMQPKASGSASPSPSNSGASPSVSASVTPSPTKP